MLKKNRTELEWTPGNGRGGLGRIRTDFVEILKKGQEPIRTESHSFFESARSLSGRKSNFQDKCGDFILDPANPGDFFLRPHMEVRTIILGKPR